jgi:hypothetical protein
MGSINIDNTGTGADVTLSSDGTDLLLDGTAIGGGGGSALELYAENPSSPTAPSATGTNAFAIGDQSVSAGTRSIALGDSYASGTDSFAAAIANNTSSYGATATGSIAVGTIAKATGNYSVALGISNVANAQYGCAIGRSNTAGNYGTAIGGGSNACYGANSAVFGGESGYVASNKSYSLVLNGWDSHVNESYSVAIGTEAQSNTIGKLVYASGKFAARGDAQGGMYILRADTTDATATVLTTNNSTAGSTNQIVAASDTCITFDGTITAMQNGVQAYASWKIEGLLVNDGGTTTLANSATTVIQNLSSWGMALSADNTNNALAITVTGEAAHNIRWVANIRTTEVTYA